MITVSMGELLGVADVLKRLVAVRLPAGAVHAKAAYDLAKLLRSVTAETQHFEDRRLEAIKELGTERDPTAAEIATGHPAGQPILAVTPENWPEFMSRTTAEAAVSVDLDVRPLTLRTVEVYELSGADMLALGPFLVEDAGPGPPS